MASSVIEGGSEGRQNERLNLIMILAFKDESPQGRFLHNIQDSGYRQREQVPLITEKLNREIIESHQ